MSIAAAQPADLLAELCALAPAERCAHLSGVAELDTVLVRLGDEAERLAVVEVARALEATAVVLELCDQLGGPRARVRARRARGQALAYSGRFDESLRVCHAAVELGQQNGEPIEAARARLASMHALGELGRYDDAVAAGEAAYAVFRVQSADELQARADINLGAVHQNRDDPQRALFHLDRAAATLADGGGMLRFFVESNRGEALWRLYRFAQAERAFRNAIEIARTAGASFAIGLAEGNLADLDARRGYFNRALYHFEHARRHFEQSAAHSHLARLLAEQAEVLAALGLIPSALDAFQQAIADLELHRLPADAARARLAFGRCLLRAHRLPEADAALDAAARAFENLGQPRARALVELRRVEGLLERGDLHEAARLAGACVAALEERPVEAAGALLMRARTALAAERLGDADADLTLARERLGRTPIAVLQAEAARLLGELHERRGAARPAADAYLDALGLLERTRGTLQTERFRTAFLGQHVGVYEDALAAMLACPADFPPERILDTVELARCRTLLERARERADGVDAAPEDAENVPAAVAELRAELNALYAQLTDVVGVSPGGDWLEAVQRRERTLAALEDRASAAARIAGGLPARPAPAAELSARLAADEALLEYFAVRGELAVCLVRRDGVQLRRRLAGWPEIEELIRRLRFQLNRAARPLNAGGQRATRLLADVQAVLHDLWLRLLAPLRGELSGITRLRIVPSAALHAVPFAALWDGRRYALESFEFSYAPSAAVFAQLRARPRSQSHSAVVLGYADEHAPLIDAESLAVADRLPAAVRFSGPAATAAALRAAAPAARILHLACHGSFGCVAPNASGLRLADGWLHVPDLEQIPLDADLVTLSGCDTGRTLAERGDELLGLQRAFLAAGARALLVSLWRLSDGAAAQTMPDFYRCWGATAFRGSKSAALRRAQLNTLQSRPHPLDWAPLILVGGAT